jgi:hypothetical protein
MSQDEKIVFPITVLFGLPIPLAFHCMSLTSRDRASARNPALSFKAETFSRFARLISPIPTIFRRFFRHNLCFLSGEEVLIP